MRPLELFVFLQALDVLTTLVGLRLGASEASPFIRLLLHMGPLAGLLASKAVALALVGVALMTERMRVVTLANYWYAALVLWNIAMLLRAVN